MSNAYDLSQLDPNAFQHMINALALEVLGNGSTGFGPGSDGGRDGYFEGEAPYPSLTERWSGRWFIQSKFHAPHLSIDSQKWLIKEIKSEIAAFEDPSGRRSWPDIWIIASNITPSATPDTGTFDVANELVMKANPRLRNRFHIWGGDKIIELLNQNQNQAIARRYGHFLTPGHVITRFMEELEDSKASAEAIIRHLIVSAIEEQRHTKLEEAGSEEDKRPGIHELFVDLPFSAKEYQITGTVANFLALAMAENHRLNDQAGQSVDWMKWRKHPSRASVWFLKGGPGQGKSTVGQFFCQIQRAALILDGGSKHLALPSTKLLASQIQSAAKERGLWPTTGRIPIYIELKQYAQWYGERTINEAKGILSHIAAKLTREVEQTVMVGTLRRALAARSWFLVFDGLDEVPSDIKDEVAKEVHAFLREASSTADLFALCTSRPQGYSGQFASIDGPEVTLLPLNESQALKCAELLLHSDRPKSEAVEACSILANAIRSPAVKELMTTPLQSHIMAIIVRSGQHPPEKKWELYRRFYDVIRGREANRSPADKKLFNLLTKDKELLKDVHNRLGFVLHARAETAKGAQSSLPRNEFQGFVHQAVNAKKDNDISDYVATIMTAATDRLVLITTPDDGRFVRFHIRQLQEFFAAEFLCDGVSPDELRTRLSRIAGDSHWQEVVHFLMSALVSSNRRTDLSVASSVLQELDEGTADGDGDDRTLCRRFARGAIMVARLMEDGVLESDRSIRNLLKERLRPLLASKDISTLSYLINTDGSASKAWLRDFLFRGLEEGTVSETMGALIILFSTLQDTDSADLERFMRYWSRLDGYQKAYIINMFDEYEEELPLWKMNCLIDFMMSRGQYIYDSRFLMTLEQDAAFVYKIASVINTKLGNEAAELIGLYTLPSEPFRTEESAWVKIYLKDLTATPKDDLMTLCEKAKGVKLSGFFESLRCALIYVCQRTVNDLVDFLLSLDDTWQGMYVLPDCILELLPYSPVYSTPDAMLHAIKSMQPEDLAAAINTPDGRLWVLKQTNSLHFKIPVKLDNEAKAEFLNLFKKHPELALSVWAYQREIGPNNFYEDSEVNEKVIDAIKNHSSIRKNVSFREWSFLISKQPHHASYLRSLLATLYRGDNLSFWRMSGSLEDIKCFKLILPLEYDIILPLCLTILGAYMAVNSGLYYHEQVNVEDVQKHIVKACPKLVRQYIPDLLELENLINDNLCPIENRAAAVLLGILHPDGGIEVAFRNQALLIAVSRLGSAAGIGVALCFEILGTERNVNAVTYMSKLLDATRLYEYGNSSRNTFVVSQQWDAVFRQWRERSHAPVTTSGQIESWLAAAEVS